MIYLVVNFPLPFFVLLRLQSYDYLLVYTRILSILSYIYFEFLFFHIQRLSGDTGVEGLLGQHPSD